jgi:hypothetical protein
VGEVLNNTGGARGRVTVTATFRSASGRVVATLRGHAFDDRTGDGGVTPFVLAGRVPAYASVSLSASAAPATAVPSLTVTRLSSAAGGGSTTESGTVKNTGSRTARDVRVARTSYGARGEVLDRRLATVSPSTLAPGRSGTFSLTRPALPTYQAGRTLVRGSF